MTTPSIGSSTAQRFSADEAAPVFVRGEVSISADPETVWEVMADVDRWPDWNPDVRDAIVHGDVAEGTTFEWKAGPGTIRSIFRVVDRANVLGWTGKTLGIPAIHVYRLEPRGGETVVVLEESWSGLLARVFKRRFQTLLDAAVANGLAALKSEAELRVTAE